MLLIINFTNKAFTSLQAGTGSGGNPPATAVNTTPGPTIGDTLLRSFNSLADAHSYAITRQRLGGPLTQTPPTPSNESIPNPIYLLVRRLVGL